jgi:predicted amidohydrolase
MSYAADPAALFVELYDELPDELFLRPDPVVHWERDAWVKRHAMRLYDHILAHGKTDPRQVRAIINEGGGHRGVFTVLRGIDWALALINPWTPSFDHDGLVELAARYAATGQFNDPTTTKGALLPRGAFPGRPRGTRSKALYFGVHHVSPQSWAKIKHETLPHRYEPSRFRPGQAISVGCAPLLESYDDVQLDFVEEDGYSGFRLTPVESQSLRKRITNVVMELDDAEAGIAVMPEATLTEELLNHWKQEVRSTAASDSQLRWLLVGTGPLGEDDPRPNRAVLIDRRTGREILSQDKLAAFILTAEQAKSWNLPGVPASGSAAEDITRGSVVTVLESSLGRLAILICEDLNQSVQWERELVECGISHLFVPIFSKPIMRYRWEQRGAESQIDNMGAWLIIANSLAVHSAMTPSKQNGEEWYTCLIAGPGDPSRRNYDYYFQFGSAETGDDLGQVKLHGELDGTLSLPVIRAAMVYDWWPGNPPDPSAT